MRELTMSVKARFITFSLVASLFTFFAPHSLAQEAAAAEGADDLVVNEANSLEELLKNVEERRVVESREHTERERRFRSERNNQQKMLKDAQDERRREERRSDRLETTFEENEIRKKCSVIHYSKCNQIQWGNG